jgi:mono/diheme cytochrome c family protein
MKTLRRLFLAAIAMLVVAIAAVYGISAWRFAKTYAVEVSPITVPDSREAVERGRYLAEAITKCMDCHGSDLGGEIMIDDPALGRFVAGNLSPGAGGIGSSYRRDDWLRAIRHGLGRDGKALLFMPSHEYHSLSDADTAALIAYFKVLEPVDRHFPDNRVGPLARLLFVTGQLKLLAAEVIDHSAKPPEPPQRAETAEFGAYLLRTGGCASCHGEDLSGGKIPGAPPGTPLAANITPDKDTGIGDWTEEDFFRAMREGRRPDGRILDSFMPWRATSRMTDGDLRAVYAALRALPPRPFGSGR